jgi:NADPH-dependent ferric siderophore reductase
MKHQIERSKFEVVRRTLTVSGITQLTPHMLRIEFTSADLAGFHSPSPDDHIKVFFPTASGETAGRDFTPRRFDAAAGTFVIDFALHPQGPAVEWACSAKVGSTLTFGGPRGTTIVPDDFDWYLMIGDASALPAFGRRLEELRADVPAYTVTLIPEQADAQQIKTAAAWHPTWLASGEDETAQTIGALNNLTLPKGDGFIWIAGEQDFSRALYVHVTEQLQHPTNWVKASKYWTREQPV